MLDAAIETVDDEKIPLFIQSGWSLSMVWVRCLDSQQPKLALILGALKGSLILL